VIWDGHQFIWNQCFFSMVLVPLFVMLNICSKLLSSGCFTHAIHYVMILCCSCEIDSWSRQTVLSIIPLILVVHWCRELFPILDQDSKLGSKGAWKGHVIIRHWCGTKRWWWRSGRWLKIEVVAITIELGALWYCTVLLFLLLLTNEQCQWCTEVVSASYISGELVARGWSL